MARITYWLWDAWRNPAYPNSQCTATNHMPDVARAVLFLKSSDKPGVWRPATYAPTVAAVYDEKGTLVRWRAIGETYFDLDFNGQFDAKEIFNDKSVVVSQSIFVKDQWRELGTLIARSGSVALTRRPRPPTRGRGVVRRRPISTSLGAKVGRNDLRNRERSARPGATQRREIGPPEAGNDEISAIPSSMLSLRNSRRELKVRFPSSRFHASPVIWRQSRVLDYRDPIQSGGFSKGRTIRVCEGNDLKPSMNEDEGNRR